MLWYLGLSHARLSALDALSICSVSSPPPTPTPELREASLQKYDNLLLHMQQKVVAPLSETTFGYGRRAR